MEDDFLKNHNCDKINQLVIIYKFKSSFLEKKSHKTPLYPKQITKVHNNLPYLFKVNRPHKIVPQNIINKIICFRKHTEKILPTSNTISKH